MLSLDKESENKKSNILEKCDFNACKSIKCFKGYNICYGNKFSNAKTLDKLLQHHPTWDTDRSYHSEGIKYPVEVLT